VIGGEEQVRADDRQVLRIRAGIARVDVLVEPSTRRGAVTLPQFGAVRRVGRREKEGAPCGGQVGGGGAGGPRNQIRGQGRGGGGVAFPEFRPVSTIVG